MHSATNFKSFLHHHAVIDCWTKSFPPTLFTFVTRFATVTSRISIPKREFIRQLYEDHQKAFPYASEIKEYHAISWTTFSCTGRNADIYAEDPDGRNHIDCERSEEIRMRKESGNNRVSITEWSKSPCSIDDFANQLRWSINPLIFIYLYSLHLQCTLAISRSIVQTLRRTFESE
jgi:hypothetical protein